MDHRQVLAEAVREGFVQGIEAMWAEFLEAAKKGKVTKIGTKAKDDEWFDFKDKNGKIRRMPRRMAAGLIHYGVGMQNEGIAEPGVEEFLAMVKEEGYVGKKPFIAKPAGGKSAKAPFAKK